MKISRARGSLLAAVALALLGTLVVGSEDRRREAGIAVAQTAAAPAASARAPADEDLDLEKLQRAKRTAPIIDVFQQKTVAAPSAAPAPVPAKVEPAPPAAPVQAPALPFRFVGRFSEDGVVRVLLAKGDQEYHVGGGETIDGLYSVDEIGEGGVTFTYLPLKTRQTLALPSSEGNP